ncbi:hypothetical protein [Shimia sediminis]|uniref:hypothetical protein n=1 Tax=Shimia sediminis TaxID=2497945 RepID=UPI000F8E858E|nr:hypothetical protein [Shimia sediminis]
MTVHLSQIRAEDQPCFVAHLDTYLDEVAPDIALSAELIADRALCLPDHESHWIVHDKSRVGFTVVQETPPGQLTLREFTIFAPLRRKGIGRQAVTALFKDRPGTWSLGISAASTHAAGFWQSVLRAIPNVSVLQEHAPDLPNQSTKLTFSIAGDIDAA